MPRDKERSNQVSKVSLPDPATRSQAAFPDPIPSIIGFGTVNILAGAPGVGKTCLLSTILARLRDGKEIFGRPSNAPAAIGFVSADRGASTARHWLDLAGYPDIRFYNFVEDLVFPTMKLRNRVQLVPVLEELVAKLDLPPGAVVVVDPVTLFMGNTNDYQACAIACIEMRRMCLRRQYTLLGTAHASKQRADAKSQYKRLQDRILGSAAQIGYGDTAMYLAAPEETNEKFHTFLWHPHTAPAQVFPLDRDPHGLFVDWLEGTQAKEEGKILAAITDAEEGTTFAEILIQSEVPKTTVFRYLQELMKEGRILKVEHGRYRKAALN